MEGRTYGYVRVSTQEQNEARQLAAMRKFGVAEENIIVEKLSGKNFNRPRYQNLTRLCIQRTYWWSRALTAWGATIRKS